MLVYEIITGIWLTDLRNIKKCQKRFMCNLYFLRILSLSRYCLYLDTVIKFFHIIFNEFIRFNIK